MSLTALRTREEELRRELAAVRTALGDAVDKARAAARAESALAGSKAADAGAYRDPAAERIHAWRAEVEAGRGAVERRDKLRHDEATLVEELEKTRLETERAGVRRSVLPMLDGIPNASPCPMRWSDMAGDGASRVCPRCKSIVVDVTMREPDAAEAILAAVPGARFHRRADGTLLARDCGGAQRKRNVLIGCATLAAVFVASVVAGIVVFARLPRMPVAAPEPPLHLAGATHLSIQDVWSGMGPSKQLSIELDAAPGGYSFDLQCGGAQKNVTRQGSVQAPVVSRFLGAVEARRPTHSPAQRCDHTDDYPKRTVLVTTGETSVSLDVLNCSHEWTTNGLPLETPQTDIDAAYHDMLAAMGTSACQAEANSMP